METPLTFDDDCYVTVKGQKYALIGIHEFAICALHFLDFMAIPYQLQMDLEYELHIVK